MVRPSLEHRAAFLAAFQEWSRAPDPAAGRAVLEGILAAQRRDPTRYVVPALLERACPGWRVAALARQQADPGQWLGELAAAEKRLNVVAALGPLGIRVWGDEGWNLCAKAGVGVAGPAGHGAELNAIYAGSRINLDVNRIYQADIATMRVFDILACGGFALVEHSEALAELFEIGVELATWRTLDDLVAQCRHYLAHPGEARRIAEAGRARVLRDHTVAQRLSTMLGEAGLEAAGQGLPKR
jgi:hypothetical protein